MALTDHPILRRTFLASVVASLFLNPVRVAAAVTVGSEISVNSHTTDNQQEPDVAADADGDFVVAWESAGQDGDGYGIFAQRYGVGGVPRGPEFRVNTATLGGQTHARVAADAEGNFVVVWHGQDGGGYGIYARRYGATGAPQGPQFRVNDSTSGYQVNPDIAIAAAGDFVVVWRDDRLGGEEGRIFARQYGADGTPTGSGFLVSDSTAFQGNPSVAVDADGDFVVAWEHGVTGGSVFARRFGADGGPLGPASRVSRYTGGIQSYPQVASDASGRFVVAWTSNGQDGDGFGVYARRHGANGTPDGLPFRVNKETTGHQSHASLAMDADGDFVVTWQSETSTALYGIFAQRFAADGTRRGSEFRAGRTHQIPISPRIAGEPDGRFVVAWNSSADGSGHGVYAQRFDRGPPEVFLTPEARNVAEVVGNTSVHVKLSELSTATVTVPFTLSGSATGGGVDYAAPSGTTIQIEPGNLTGGFPLAVVNDSRDEFTETIVAKMGSPTNGLKGPNAIQTLALVDDDPLPTVGFNRTTRSIGEGGTSSVDVLLDAISGKAVTIQLTATGTAESGVDYQALPVQVRIPAGALSKRVFIETLGDTAVEGDESIALTLSGPINAVLGTSATFNAKIVDDD